MSIRRAVILAVVVIGAACAAFYVTRRPSAQSRHVFVVRIPLERGVELRPVIAHGKVTRSESFDEMVTRLKPYAAINGTFFSSELKPLGDIVIDGKLANRGHYPNAIAAKSNGQVVFVRRTGRRFDWRGYTSALAAGPRLVHKGRIKLDLKADGFRLLGLEIKAPRSGIGLTRCGELLLVVDTDYVTIPDFAQTMLDQGAVEAMNLDGGPASGLYHDGKTLVPATLRMTNILMVVKRNR